MQDYLQILNKQWAEDLLLTNKSHLDLLTEQAGLLLKNSSSSQEFSDLESKYAQDEDISLGLKVAIKLAKSKALVANIKTSTFVSVVFAVYGEQNRMLTAEEHPNGEDFLHRKIDQLQWLFDENPNVNWEMMVVDDGCPNGSGKMAERILNNKYENVKVVYLQHGINVNHLATVPLHSTKESRKGGSILYGMALAAEKSPKGKHIIVFTDADLSTHLGQTGILLDSIFKPGNAGLNCKQT